MFEENDVVIRPIRQEDIYSLWEITYKEESPEWKKWDAPYFEHKTMTYDDFFKKRDKIIDQEHYWGIEVEGKIIGTVSYYWEHERRSG